MEKGWQCIQFIGYAECSALAGAGERCALPAWLQQWLWLAQVGLDTRGLRGAGTALRHAAIIAPAVGGLALGRGAAGEAGAEPTAGRQFHGWLFGDLLGRTP